MSSRRPAIVPSARLSPIVMRTPPIRLGSTDCVTSNFVWYAAASRSTIASSSLLASGRALVTRSVLRAARLALEDVELRDDLLGHVLAALADQQQDSMERDRVQA